MSNVACQDDLLPQLAAISSDCFDWLLGEVVQRGLVEAEHKTSFRGSSEEKGESLWRDVLVKVQKDDTGTLFAALLRIMEKKPSLCKAISILQKTKRDSRGLASQDSPTEKPGRAFSYSKPEKRVRPPSGIYEQNAQRRRAESGSAYQQKAISSEGSK